MIVRIVPIVPVASLKISRPPGRLGRLLISIRSSRSLQRLNTRGRQRCSWVRQHNFGAIFGKEMADVNRRASLLACYLIILSILHRRRARRIPRRHRFWVWNQMEQTFSFSSIAHTRFRHSYIFFLLQPRPSQISLLLLSRYSFL